MTRDEFFDLIRDNWKYAQRTQRNTLVEAILRDAKLRKADIDTLQRVIAIIEGA